MEPSRPGLGHVARRGDLSSLEPEVVRLLTIMATFASIVLFTLFIATGDGEFARRGIAAALVGLIGTAMIAVRRPHALGLFTATTAIIIFATKLAVTPGGGSGSAIALVMIGVVASAFVTRGRRVYLAGFTGVVIAAHILWTGEFASGVAAGSITATVFVFGSVVFSWFRTRVGLDAKRYENLFTRAPVSIWEEDFTEVAGFLDGLRSEGVTDLAAYLDEHPQVLRVAAGKIRVEAVNDAAVELIEAGSKADLIGRLNPETLTDDALQSLVPQLLGVWNRDDHIVLEVSGGLTLAGNPLDAILSWTVPSIGDELDLSHVIVAIVDVTAIRAAQAQTEALLRSKDEFVASVSHELRTPLTAVVGLAAELRDSLDRFSREEMREFVGLIANQGEEVSTIVDDLLAAAKSDAGTLDVRIEPIEVVAELRVVLRGMGLQNRVQVDTNGAIPAIAADGARFRQIIRNLLVNAQRYGGDDIRVSVGRAGDPDARAVFVDVRDTGPPLPSNVRAEIFERYYRTGQVPGLTASVGLGLTVSRDLARRMGGDLGYDHDGTEAVFRLLIPAAERVAA